MYLIISRSFTPRNEDKAIANICAEAPASTYTTVEDAACRAVRRVAFFAEGDGAEAFNACFNALKEYGMALDPDGRVYPTGAFDVTGYTKFLPKFMAEQESRGIVSPEVI